MLISTFLVVSSIVAAGLFGGLVCLYRPSDIKFVSLVAIRFMLLVLLKGVTSLIKSQHERIQS